MHHVQAADALEFVDAAVGGRSSFASRQISSVLLEFVSEAQSAVDQMRSQPLPQLVRQGRAAVVRLSAGQKPGEVLCERDEASRNSEARRGIQAGDCVAVGCHGSESLIEAEASLLSVVSARQARGKCVASAWQVRSKCASGRDSYCALTILCTRLTLHSPYHVLAKPCT